MRKLLNKFQSKGKQRAQEHPTGIKILHDPQHPCLDVVFVHGLNGHREDTWRHQNATTSWPEALLRDDIPYSRIMTYGYDATVTNTKEFLGKVSVNGIQQHAQNLLETLASYRSDHMSHERAIIFVCHSLGGIVCKDAVLRSQDWINEPYIAAISRSTRGIIFLGTPHSGAPLATWAFQLARALELVKQTNTTLLGDLKTDSKPLKGIQERFDKLLDSRSAWKFPPVQIKCFYEEKPIFGGDPVVDYESATLARNIPIGINKDHRQMTRFEHREDPGYSLIKFTINRWVDEINTPVAPTHALPIISSASDTSFAFPNMSDSPTLQSAATSQPSESRSSSPESSSSSSFVKIPPGGRFIINEKLVKLPFEFIPSRFKGRESKYFQPREIELEKIRATLFSPDQHALDISFTSHRSFLMTGLGGAGKTVLAYRFAMQFKHEFDAVFFLIADSESRLLEQYSTIASHLGLVESSDKTDQDLCSETFRTWLHDPVKGAPDTQEVKTTVKWLLVFDNAENSEVIGKFWPAGCTGRILITTRNPVLASGLPSITDRMQLQGFPAEHAAEFLRHCAEDHIPKNAEAEDDATTIAEWVEGFPMAIDQLGRIIYSEHLSISQFRKLYPTKKDLFNRLYIGHDDGKNLVTVWALNALQKKWNEAFSLLCLIAMFDPEQIEERTLRPRPATPANMNTYVQLRKHLANRSLIDVNRNTGEVRVHRIVQEVTKEMMMRAGDALSSFKIAVYRVAEQWPFLNKNYVTGSATRVDRWEECRQTYPHILRLMEIHVELAALKINCLPSLDLAELLLEAAQYRLESGAGHEAIPLLEAAEGIYRERKTDPQALEEEQGKLYRGRVGLAVSSKNGSDLLHYAQLGFEVEKQRHLRMGHATSILAVAYNDLAMGWACHCEWENAIAQLKESRRIREELPGFSRDKLFSPLYHLGLVYHHQGRYDEAEKILNEAIRDREQAFGPEDAVSLRSAALLYARGNARFSRADRRRGDLMKSLNDHKDAASRAARTAGANNRTTLICQYQVARVSVRLEDYDTASRLLDNVLSNSIEKPTYERDVARTTYLYSKCLKVQEKYAESNRWLLKSLEIHNRVRPREARTTGTLSDDDISKLIPYDFL